MPIYSGTVRFDFAVPAAFDTRQQEFRLPAKTKPDLVLLDPDHELLLEARHATWTAEELRSALLAAPNAVDREDALRQLLTKPPADTTVQDILTVLRQDRSEYPVFRSVALLGALKRNDLRQLFEEQLSHPNYERLAASFVVGCTAKILQRARQCQGCVQYARVRIRANAAAAPNGTGEVAIRG